MKRFVLCLLMLAAAASLTAAEDQGASLALRDDVWRSIFKRPADIPNPADNPATPEKIALGAALFADVRLSGDQNRACASCHNPARGFTDGRRKARARDGSDLRRNTPALYNLAWAPHLYADGRAASLEAQARSPITTAIELGATFEAIAARLAADPATAKQFAAAFPSAPQVSEANIVAALAAFERTLISPETRFDRWVTGDDTALTDTERDGFSVFVGKGGCVGCHGGWRFTDDGFRDIGLPGDDPGRSAITGASPELRQFKTPSLRELTRTAPYMHDGSLGNLRDVVNHYSGGFVKRPSLDSNLVRDLALTETEKEALITFLESLSSNP